MESDVKPLVSVLCVGPSQDSIANLRKSYKRIAISIHLDLCGNEQNAARGKRRITPTWNMVENLLAYDSTIGCIAKDEEFLLFSGIKYDDRET